MYMNESCINKSSLVRSYQRHYQVPAYYVLFRIVANLELRHVHISRNLRSPCGLIRLILKSDAAYAHASLNFFLKKKRKIKRGTIKCWKMRDQEIYHWMRDKDDCGNLCRKETESSIGKKNWYKYFTRMQVEMKYIINSIILLKYIFK